MTKNRTLIERDYKMSTLGQVGKNLETKITCAEDMSVRTLYHMR